MNILLTSISLASVIGSTFATYSDSNFSSQTTNFSTGANVYFKLVSNSSGGEESSFNLLNSQKGKVMSLDINRSGSGPYTYTANFKAPNEPGVYYVDVKLKDNSSSSFSGQRNINISGVEEPERTNIPDPSETEKSPEPVNEEMLNSSNEPEIVEEEDNPILIPLERDINSYFQEILKILRNLFSSLKI